MKHIKLNIKTNSENYPIIIGSNIIQDLDIFLKKIQLILIDAF